MKTALLVYQQEQVLILVRYLRTLPETKRNAITIVGVGADIELALEQEGIESYSAQGLRTYPSFERRVFAERIGQGIFMDSAMSFLEYRDVPYGRVHAHALQRYLDFFLYNLDVAHTLVEKEQPTEILVMQSERIGFTADILADLMERAVADAVQAVGDLRGIAVTVMSSPNSARLRRKKTLFRLKRWLFGVWVGLSNIRVSILVAPRPLRLLISDTWRNIGPYLALLPEAEVLLWERTEIDTIGRKNIDVHRMRFNHAHAYTRASHYRIASTEARGVLERWEHAQGQVRLIREARFKDVPLHTILLEAIDHIVRVGTKEDIRDIEDTYRMFEVVRPHVVLVRASDSLQTHFSFLCYVARALSVPSIEVQHGIYYLGRGSYASHMAAEYVATYGSATHKEFTRSGFPPENLFATGSPRFDGYSVHRLEQDGPKSDEFHICYVLSAVEPGMWLDTYDVAELLHSLHESTAGMPQVRVSVAVRPDSSHTPFVAHVVNAFPASSRLRLSGERAVHLARACSLVVVGHSTLLLEALLLGKPVVHDATPKLYAEVAKESVLFDAVPIPIAQTAAEMKALITRYSDKEELEQLTQTQQERLALGYATDAKSSERLVDCIRGLAERTG